METEALASFLAKDPPMSSVACSRLAIPTTLVVTNVISTSIFAAADQMPSDGRALTDVDGNIEV